MSPAAQAQAADARGWAGRKLVAAGAVATGALGVLIGLTSPLVAGAVVVGAAAVVATTLLGGWLTLYVAAFPFQGVSLAGVQAFGFRLSHVFFLVALLAAVAAGLARPRMSAGRLKALDAFVVAFAVLKVASVAWSQAPLPRAAVEAAKMVFDLVVYFALAAMVRRDAVGTIRRVNVGFAIAFVVMMALTVYNLAELGFRGLVASLVLESAATTTGFGAVDALSRATSAFTGEANRNIIAAWEVLGLMLAWGFLSDRWRGLRRTEKSLWLVAFASAAGYIVLSLSRATWLSLAAGAVILWWRAGHRVSRRVVAAVGVASAAVFAGVAASGLLPVLIDRVQALKSVQDYGIISRMEIWRAGWHQFTTHPLLGVGIQGTEALTRELTAGTGAGNLHNVYLQSLAELGVIGSGVFVGMVVCVFWSLDQAGRHLPPALRRIAWGLFAAIGCYLVQGLAQYDFMDLGIWTLFGLSAGMVRVWRDLPQGQGTPA